MPPGFSGAHVFHGARDLQKLCAALASPDQIVFSVEFKKSACDTHFFD
jgi:hypothetical protein